MPLSDTFDFTPDDLIANQHGATTERQRQRILAQRRAQFHTFLKSARMSAVALWCLGVAAFSYAWWDAGHGQDVGLLGLVSVGWAGAIALHYGLVMILLSRRLVRPIELLKAVGAVYGHIQPADQRHQPFTLHMLQVGGTMLRVRTEAEIAAFQRGAIYRVYYADASPLHLILAAETYTPTEQEMAALRLATRGASGPTEAQANAHNHASEGQQERVIALRREVRRRLGRSATLYLGVALPLVLVAIMVDDVMIRATAGLSAVFTGVPVLLFLGRIGLAWLRVGLAQRGLGQMRVYHVTGVARIEKAWQPTHVGPFRCAEVRVGRKRLRLSSEPEARALVHGLTYRVDYVPVPPLDVILSADAVGHCE